MLQKWWIGVGGNLESGSHCKETERKRQRERGTEGKREREKEIKKNEKARERENTNNGQKGSTWERNLADPIVG